MTEEQIEDDGAFAHGGSDPSSLSAEEEQELRILIQRLTRRIRAERSDKRFSDSHLGVLLQLERNGDQSPRELAHAEQVSPPSINRTLNALADADFAQRHPSETDARKVVVSITEAGRALLDETRRLRNAWFHEHLAALDPSERAQLREVLPILRRLADS